MNIREKKNIKVYNECPSQVNLIGQRREYIFPPCEDEPTMNFVDFDEIEYAHSRTKVFTLGLLRFDEDEQEEMYAALGIKNWKEKVWFKKDIEDYIQHPTAEKMQRIIDTNNISAFERIRAVMVKYMNEHRDISQNVINIINARYNEICSGVLNSKIVIRSSDITQTVSSDEVDELKRQLEEMKSMIAQMMKTTQGVQAAQEESKAQIKAESKTEPKVEPKVGTKRPGRKTTVKK